MGFQGPYLFHSATLPVIKKYTSLAIWSAALFCEVIWTQEGDVFCLFCHPCFEALGKAVLSLLAPYYSMCPLFSVFPALPGFLIAVSHEELPIFEEQSRLLVGEEKGIQEEGSQSGL